MLGNRGMVLPPKNMAYRILCKMLGVEIFGVTSSQAVLGSQVHNAARSDTAIKLHADCLYVVWPRSTALLALREGRGGEVIIREITARSMRQHGIANRRLLKSHEEGPLPQAWPLLRLHVSCQIQEIMSILV